MKIQSTLLFILIMLIAGPFIQSCSAQAAYQDWQQVTLNIYDGTNDVSGVEGYYMLAKCNGANTVFLKLVNHNNYPVKAGWKDMVVTKDGQRLPGANVQDSVTIGANAEIKGDCAVNPQLVFKLSDFTTDLDNFDGIITSDFDFIVIHER